MLPLISAFTLHFVLCEFLHVDCLEVEQRADVFLKLDFYNKILFKKML